jgi:peptidoglycan/xylan/chitin deacetylase (PgdA/CDA1 family)
MGVAGIIALLIALVVALEDTSGSTSREPRVAGTRAHASRPSAEATRRGLVHEPMGSGTNTAIRHLLALGRAIYCGGSRGREVALTFDDGPGPYTYLAVRKLARAHERATFFVVGRSMDMYRGYLPRELRVAAIGDHTYTHTALTALSPSEVRWQLGATAQKIEAQSGEHVDLWRPPYELHNATVDAIARRLGLLEILWDVDSQDSLGANYAQIIKNVEAGLRPGAIIELHENHGQTIRALTTLLPALHRRHLRSVPVPELLASDPPSRKQVGQGLNGCTGAVRVRAFGAE